MLLQSFLKKQIKGELMNIDMIEFIKSRRSTRKFKTDSIEREIINTVIEAGRYAPSGGNCQSTHFIVITDKKVLNELSAVVAEELKHMDIVEEMNKSLKYAILASRKGKYIFHYNAPVLIVVTNKKNNGNNMADCSCALENMMLMANALDLGSCWINQLKWLNENVVIENYLKTIGMEGTENVYGALALGMPDSKDGLPNREPLERTGNLVTWR